MATIARRFDIRHIYAWVCGGCVHARAISRVFRRSRCMIFQLCAEYRAPRTRIFSSDPIRVTRLAQQRLSNARSYCIFANAHENTAFVWRYEPSVSCNISRILLRKRMKGIAQEYFSLPENVHSEALPRSDLLRARQGFSLISSISPRAFLPSWDFSRGVAFPPRGPVGNGELSQIMLETSVLCPHRWFMTR